MKPPMTREEYKAWLQANNAKPKMPGSEARRRSDMNMEDEVMVCPCVFYDGYRIEEWCDWCLGPRPYLRRRRRRRRTNHVL